MKTIRLLLLLGCLPLAAFAQNQDSIYIRKNYEKTEVQIAMRDGAQLFTSIYAPKDKSKKYPILMKRTPYSCAPYGADKFVTNFQNMTLARSGYIFVFQDVRGRYMSEGEFVDVRPFVPKTGTPNSEIDEATDTYDAVDWLVKNLPNCNGKVGVYGISYPGFYATMAALAGHPAIKAVSPQAPVTDWFVGDDFHHNGALMLMDAFAFYSGFGKPRPEPTTESAKGFEDWKTPDNYDFFLRAGALPNFTNNYGMGEIPFWNDLMTHPDMDDFWKARNPRPHLKNIKPAMLTVGGLFDAEDCFGAWATYKAIESQNPPTHPNRIVMGPWVHGGWARTTGERLGSVVFGSKTSDFFQTKIEAPFFEQHLKDAPDPKLPDAYIFETGSNKWTTYPAWPPKNAIKALALLQPGGKIKIEKDAKRATQNASVRKRAPGSQPASDDGMGYDEYISDPAKPVPYTEKVHLNRTREYMTDDQRFAARRPDVLVYQTDVLTEPLTVTGPVTADLWVSTSSTDADFVVKLIDVFPDTLTKRELGVPLGGYQMLVRGEIFRGRYRNSFEAPEPFEPEVPTRVKFDLPDVAHTFLPGHKLMVQIQSSWFPLADRNPQQFVNIYEATDADFVKATHRVYFSQEFPSAVVLPVLKR